MRIQRSKEMAQRGFTLVEMLLVLAILAILSGIVYPSVIHRREQADLTAAKAQITAIKTAIGTFETDNGFVPQGRDGLQALVQKPRDARNWKGPYMERIPDDPWGNKFVYVCPGKVSPLGFDVISMGPDGRLGSSDDIVN